MCFLTALCFKASSLPTETNAGVAVPCIQKKRKEREPPPPTPGRPADLFPGKMCRERGGAPFVAAARIWSLGARLNNKRIPLGGSSQKSPARSSGAQGRGGPGPSLSPSGSRAGLNAPARGSTRSPGRNPGNVAGTGSIWTVLQAEGGGQTRNFSGAFAQIPLELFKSCKVETYESKKVAAPLPPAYFLEAKAPNSRPASTQTPLSPVRRTPSLCLREEALPRLETHRAGPGRCFQLARRHLVAGLGGHTGPTARPASL